MRDKYSWYGYIQYQDIFFYLLHIIKYLLFVLYLTLQQAGFAEYQFIYEFIRDDYETCVIPRVTSFSSARHSCTNTYKRDTYTGGSFNLWVPLGVTQVS